MVQQDLTLVAFAGGALGFNWLPVFVADRFGFFARHGIVAGLRRMGAVDKATMAVMTCEARLATIATARKLLTIIYYTLKNQWVFNDFTTFSIRGEQIPARQTS